VVAYAKLPEAQLAKNFLSSIHGRKSFDSYGDTICDPRPKGKGWQACPCPVSHSATQKPDFCF